MMPKEQVMTAKWEKFTRSALDADGGEEFGMTYPEVFIRWAGGGLLGGGNVQVHMTTYPETPWHELKVNEEGHPVVWPRPTEVFSGVLTRADINNLIKVLRRARDSAYGRDE